MPMRRAICAALSFAVKLVLSPATRLQVLNTERTHSLYSAIQYTCTAPYSIALTWVGCCLLLHSRGHAAVLLYLAAELPLQMLPRLLLLLPAAQWLLYQLLLLMQSCYSAGSMLPGLLRMLGGCAAACGPLQHWRQQSRQSAAYLLCP